VCVFLFAFGGKSSHEAGSSDWVVLAIVWPFVVAVLVAHVVLNVRDRSTRRVWPEGATILAATYVLGLVLRVVSGRGIEIAFLVVAALFLALTMLGWRAVVRLTRRPRVSSARGDG
jgi:FtsH-binding integral membrane protein